MIQHEVSKITKDVSKDQLWKLMSNVNEWHTWDTTIEYAKLHGDFKSGSPFTLRPKGGPTVKIKLVEVNEGVYFKDLTSFPLAKMYGEHWYEETPEGLRISVKMTMTGLLGRLWNKIVMKNIVAHLEEDIENQIASAKKVAA